MPDPRNTPVQIPTGGGLENHVRPVHHLPAVLDVVAVVSNPILFASRYNLYRAFERHMANSGVRLTTVELAHGDRPFEITQADNPRNVQLRTTSELWHKENLINLGVQRLPSDWQYVAWIDADVTFARPDWVQETMQQLQHYPAVQLFSKIVELGPNHEPYDSEKGLVQSSFAACYQNALQSGYLDSAVWPCYGARQPLQATASVQPKALASVYSISPLAAASGATPPTTAEYWHTGYAWAMTREAFEGVGGLIDRAILGAADHHMAWSMIGYGLQSVHGGATSAYHDMVAHWQSLAAENIKGNVGCVDGLIIHYFHGPKACRKYSGRWEVIVNNHFDPNTDLKRDWQGLLSLTGRNPGLRDGIMAYFRGRDEDSTSIK